MRLATYFPFFALSVVLAGLSSCKSSPPHPGADYLAGIGGPVPTAPSQLGVTEHISYWDDDGSPGSPHIVVDLRRQVAEFYKGNKVIGVAAISSGKEGRNTPPGDYKNAVVHAHSLGRSRHARRLFAGLSGQPRLHPHGS
jgi:hypothetical protein